MNRNDRSEAVAGMICEDEIIAGIILTAGYSSRMGSFKPLLQIGDKTAIEWIADTYQSAGILPPIAVTGYKRELLQPILDKKGVWEAYNQDFDKGMFTSIQKGTREALQLFPDEPEGYFLMLVDSPLVSSNVLSQILDKHREVPDAFIVPCFQGKKGHPLFIPACFTDEILSHTGEGGLKAITGRHEDRMIRLEVKEEAVVLDMDTQEGYQELLDYYNERQKHAKCLGIGWEESGETFAKEQDSTMKDMLKGKRLFLIRHGEIRQHDEKIFLGQTDVSLSEKGRSQAQAAAEELVCSSVKPRSIYSSDLMRAAETAEIIQSHLNEAQGNSGVETPVIVDRSLREMSLGKWDGCFIRVIKERYPDEYRRRGEQLLTYKFDGTAENFYDLQYRVMKGFRRILEHEADLDCEDIVIVSHLGVINSILCKLQNMPLETGSRQPVANGGVITLDFREQIGKGETL